MRILPRHNVNFGLSEVRSALSRRDELRPFEEAFAQYHGMRHALATGSGRAALYLALRHLDIPVGATVALPSYSFYTLPAVVEACGLSIAFVPCDPNTYAIDPLRLDEHLPEGTAVLVVLHPFGQAAPMDPILETCARRGVMVVEDPSQSIGARYRSARVGSFGKAAAFSLVSGKNMTACGGGVLLTDDDTLAGRARADLKAAPEVSDPWKHVISTGARWLLSTRIGFACGLYAPFLALSHIDRPRFATLFDEAPVAFEPGRGITRLGSLQASIGLAQLQRLDALNAVRLANARYLLEALADLPGIEVPRVVAGCEPTFNAVAVRVPDAVRFRGLLLDRGIDSREDYMRWYGGEGSRRDEVVYLPNHPGLSRADLEYLVRIVREIIRAEGPSARSP